MRGQNCGHIVAALLAEPDSAWHFEDTHVHPKMRGGRCGSRSPCTFTLISSSGALLPCTSLASLSTLTTQHRKDSPHPWGQDLHSKSHGVRMMATDCAEQACQRKTLSSESHKQVVQTRPLTSGRFLVSKMGAQNVKVDCRPSSFEPPFLVPQNGRCFWQLCHTKRGDRAREDKQHS